MDRHGQRPGTYFQGRTPSIHALSTGDSTNHNRSRNRGSIKLSTSSPPLARRRPHRGFLMGTLGRAQTKKCNTYSAHHSSRADILKDGTSPGGSVRRGVRSDGKPSGRRSCPTGNLSRRIPRISSLSCGGLAGFRPTTVHSIYIDVTCP